MKNVVSIGVFLLILAMCVVLWSIKLEYGL